MSKRDLEMEMHDSLDNAIKNGQRLVAENERMRAALAERRATNRLTTLDVRCLLADLDLAIKYRHDPDLIEECVTRAKDCLLRAALADVEVEAVEQRRAA